MTTNARQTSKAATDSESKRTVPKKAPTPTDWKGDEVEDGTANVDSAETRAARAEGNTPVLAREAAAQSQAEETSGTKRAQKSERASPATAADDVENAEEKRIAAAEEHAAVLSRHHPRGSL